MPTPQELGVKMAKALLLELEVPPNTKKQKSHEEILSVVPSEGAFFSHTDKGVKVESTKEALLEYMLKDKKSLVAFCCVSLQIDTRSTFDIDHVFPREKITEKQKLLLEYLNKPENKELSQSFMGELDSDNAHRTAIGEYFKRDSTDVNKIKGTNWFFDVCYNNLSNLFHLKHYLNRGKSAATPGEWFEKNLPPKLLSEIKSNGGVNEGVVMQQVFPIVVDQGHSTKVELEKINLGKVRDKKGKEVGEDVIVYLHETAGIGLGEMVRGWFKANASEAMENSKDIHAINSKLTTMLDDDLCENGNKDGVEKFLVTVNAALKLAEDRSKLGRASSEDSEKAGESRTKVSYKSLLKAFNHMHAVKKMKKQVLKITDAVSQAKVQDEFYDACIEHLFDLTDRGRDKAVTNFAQACEQKQQLGEVFTADEVMKLIEDSALKGNFEQIADVETQGRIAAQQRADAAEQATQQEKARADALILGLFQSYLALPEEHRHILEAQIKASYASAGIKQPYEEWKVAGIARATTQKPQQVAPIQRQNSLPPQQPEVMVHSSSLAAQFASVTTALTPADSGQSPPMLSQFGNTKREREVFGTDDALTPLAKPQLKPKI